SLVLLLVSSVTAHVASRVSLGLTTPSTHGVSTVSVVSSVTSSPVSLPNNGSPVSTVQQPSSVVPSMVTGLKSVGNSPAQLPLLHTLSLVLTLSCLSLTRFLVFTCVPLRMRKSLVVTWVRWVKLPTSLFPLLLSPSLKWSLVPRARVLLPC
ncbi:hypothetical protein HDU76_007322, partial [Blyttiomyces sp. JEL0837]